MALTKDYEIIQIELLPAHQQSYIAFNFVILDNGIVISSTNHRLEVNPLAIMSDIIDWINSSLNFEGYPALTAEDEAFISASLQAAADYPGKAKLPRPQGIPIPPPPTVPDPVVATAQEAF